MPDSIPQAPLDLSGGFMILGIRNGTDTHHMRLHVLPFSLSAFIVGGGTPSVGADDGNHDYAYTPDRVAGMEAGLSDTFQAYVNSLKYNYSTTWTFTFDALYQMQSGVPVEIFPVPNVSPIAGTDATAAPVGQQRAYQQTWNFRTGHGNRAKIIMVGKGADQGLAVPATVGANASGTNDQKLVAYLSGSATGIVAHDGQKMQASAHVTNTINRRLRRHYGYA